MNRKVTVVGGAGNVGATVARAIANQELADVVLIDIADTKAQGVALDIFQACPIEGSDARLMGGSDFADSAGSDVVVITSGVPRKPGMSRDDLLLTNFRIMKQVTEQIVRHSPDCIIVPVANPLDAMCWAVHKLSGFPRERVIGMAGILDSARMRTFIAMELNVSVENVHAAVLGGHGDTMVPRAARRLRSSLVRPPGMRRGSRRPRWSPVFSRTRRRSSLARCTCKVSTDFGTCSSAYR
jgi:malate dehydrogenase